MRLSSPRRSSPTQARGPRNSTTAQGSRRRPKPSPRSRGTLSHENRAPKIAPGIAENAERYLAATVGTAVVFGQQPSGLMCASRAASKHLPTRTLGSLDTDAARISLAFASASAVLARCSATRVFLLDVHGVHPILGGFVVIHERHNHIEDLDLVRNISAHLIAQRLDVGAVGVHRGQRIEVGEHLDKGGPELPVTRSRTFSKSR